VNGQPTNHSPASAGQSAPITVPTTPSQTAQNNAQRSVKTPGLTNTTTAPTTITTTTTTTNGSTGNQNTFTLIRNKTDIINKFGKLSFFFILIWLHLFLIN